jgi:hypothetical protein
MPHLRTATPLVALLALLALVEPVRATTSAYAGRPFGDAVHASAPQPIPGPVFCAYYDQGGEGVAYHDTDAVNHGSGRLNPADGSYLHEFRQEEGIDTSYTKRMPDRESPCNRVVPPLGLLYVGWNEPGEWFRLTVETTHAGTYVADVLYTSQRGATVRLDVEGQPAGHPFAFTSTFDPAETIPWRQWHHWAVARDAFTVTLPRGRSVLTVRILTGGNMNLATLLFRPEGTPRDERAILRANTPAAARAVWRPFSDDSPWNERVPADAATDPDSAALIEDFASRGPLHINIKDWSVPVYFVDAGHTPRRDVGDSRPGVYGAGFEFPRAIPIPDDAIASPPDTEDSDNHLCIVDRTRHLEWGMWAARKDHTGRWFTGLGAVTDLDGTGVAVPWFAAAREFDSHRARASGFPLIAGLILRDEIRAGRIDHALVFAYDHCRGGWFVPPASTAQVATPAINETTGIPMGGRIQLDPAWDVEHSSLSRSGKIIARALQLYGAFCGDFAGANVIYAENSPAAVREWQGVLDYDELKHVFTPEFIRTHFRVVAMGSILPGQNLRAVPPPYVVSFTMPGETAPAAIDQLSRTIKVSLPAGAAVSAPRWTLAPAASSATWSAGSSDVLGRLTATAPDGRTSVWRVTRNP